MNNLSNIKRSHLIIGAIIVVVLMGVLLFISRSGSGTLEITAPDKTPKNAAVAVEIKRDGAEEQNFTLKPGETKKIRLKTGTVRVDGWADTLKAVDIVTIKGFSTTKLTTPSGEQLAAQQLASGATYCPVIAGGKTYSYGCEGDGPITYHEANSLGASLNTVLFDGLSFSSLKPFKNGLLGYYATAGNALDVQYINLVTRQVTKISLPENIDKYLAANQPEIAVTHDPNGSRFALVFSSDNKAFVFDDITDTDPIEIKPGENTRLNEEGRRARVSFDGDKPVLFMGISTDLHEGEVVTETNEGPSTPDLDSYLFEYDKGGKLTSTLHIPKDVDAQGMYALGDGFYAAEQAHGFSFYHKEDNDLVHTYTIDDMGSWTIANGNVYVESAGTLYKFTPGSDGLFSLRSVFSSSQIVVSTIFTGPDGITFTGLTSRSSDAPLNIYKLLKEGEKAGNTTPSTDPSTGGDTDTPTAPIFSGLDELLYYGVSADQVDNLNFALSNYVATSTSPISSIGLSSFEPVPHDRFSESTTDAIHFDVIINNDDTLRGKLEYSDLSTIRLYLFKVSTGSQVFDSGVINHSQSPSYNPEPAH